MHLGLIGGIGPAATIVYYDGLVRAFATAGHRLELTIVNADAHEMIANIEAGRPADQAAIFARYIDRLKAAGCDAAALTSMGGHFCIAELEMIASLPLITALPALNAYFAAQPVKRVGVLGTRTVMESGLYGVSTVEVVAPAPEDLPDVHREYVRLAAAGAATPGQCAFFRKAARKLRDERGAELIVLGGTDLSIAFKEDADPDVPLVDSAMIHVDAIARAALAQ